MKSKSPLLASFILFFLPLGVFGQTFHAIMFADTFDPKIGESCLSDFEKMEVEFATMARANGMELNRLFFNDYDFTKEKLVDAISNLKCGPEDVVYFYYTGHGARAATDQSKWPQLSLGMAPKTDVQHFPMAMVDEMLAEKKPKLRILMADCCNKIVGGLTSKTSRGATMVLEGMDPVNSVYRALFREIKGSVLCTSSSPGEMALGNNEGGIFTMNFLDALSESVAVGKGDWKAILKHAKLATMDDSQGFRQYTPQFQIEVEEALKGEEEVADGKEAHHIPEIIIPEEGSTVDKLLAIADQSKSRTERIKMIDQVVSKVFASDMAKVEVYGRDGKTLLERETARDFVKRLSISQRLVNMVEIKSKTNGNGKVEEIQIHEFYKKR